MLWGGLSPTPPPITYVNDVLGMRKIPFTATLSDEEIRAMLEQQNAGHLKDPYDLEMDNLERLRRNIEETDTQTTELLDKHREMYFKTDDPDRHEHLSRVLDNELFDLDTRLNDRLFGWLPDSCHSMSDGSLGTVCRSFSILCLIAIYGIGFGLIILLNQRISMCDQGVVMISDDIKNLTDIQHQKCSGLADECELTARFITFRTYVNYRMTAYVFLLLPFLYIPYMSILELTHTAKKVWDEFKFTAPTQPLVKPTVTYLSREDTFKEQGKIMYGLKKSRENLYSMSSVGHETVLLILFLVFHVILGCFSLCFDYLLMKIDTTKESTCDKLKSRLNNFNNGIYLDLDKVGTYNFAMGIITLILTLTYMCFQCTNTLYKHSRKKENKRLDKNDNKIKSDMEKFKLQRDIQLNIEKKRDYKNKMIRAKGKATDLQMQFVKSQAFREGRKGTPRGGGSDDYYDDY